MNLTTLRTFVETDLADAALQVVLDAAEEDLTRAVGSEGGMIEEREMEGQPNLWLERPAESITSVTETDDEGTVTALVAADYHLHPNRMRMKRLATGTNPKTGWTGTVTVSYIPGDLDARNRAIAELVELALVFRPGAASESVGDFQRIHQDYDRERARIIASAQSRAMA